MPSTSRPTPLRFAGFLALALGGLGMGLGALLTWATVGFRGDLTHRGDIATMGIDVWEGKVVLAIGVATLVGIVAMRLLSTVAARRAAAAAILVLGPLAAGLAAADALRAESRFVPTGPMGRMAGQLMYLDLRVDLGPGIWLAIAGGLPAAIGGVLSLVWAGRQGLPTNV
jgi:hypothetical protein